MDESPETSSKTSIGELVTTSCERCRRRKIKCDRRQPCSRCRKAGVECARAGTGEKQRPVPKTYVRALEGQIASLEVFIQKLSSADADQREQMLAAFNANGASSAPDHSTDTNPSDPEAGLSQGDPSATQLEQDEVGLARPRAGQLRKLAAGNSAHFYGGTSLFHIYVAEGEIHSPPSTSVAVNLTDMTDLDQTPHVNLEVLSPHNGCFQYAPHDDVSQRLMASFFREQYSYNMYVYREYFLRDYDTGTGRYYSDLLLFAICAMGALATGDPADLQLFNVFSAQAQQLLYPALDRPDLTSLQALLLLGQCEIGRGRASKGWLFCGMAFRLAHEMGLHLDPNNWRGGTSEPDVDREILRRVYWAAFIVDKQLSLYFGRPPALYLYESDVRNTVRLPYPPDWEGLLDTYIAPGLSVTAFEDGIALVGAFIHQAELSKIQHSIITELFENRRSRAHNATTAATVQKLHVSLTRWLASLPGKLYWNQWTVGKVPACVLHLHMRFHTAMIILHRPPRHLLSQPETAGSEDVEICYESLQVILRLLRSYSRFYRYECLPIDFVHTLATAAGTIMMRHYLEGTPWDEGQTPQSLGRILEAMNAIQEVWPCVIEVRDSIIHASKKSEGSIPRTDALADFSLMTGLSDHGQGNDSTSSLIPQLNEDGFEGTLGLLVTDEFLGGTFPWIT